MKSRFRFLRQNGSLNMIEAMISARDRGSLRRKEHQEQLYELTRTIVKNLTVIDEGGNLVGYEDMCEPYCDKNAPLFAFMELLHSNLSSDVVCKFSRHLSAGIPKH